QSIAAELNLPATAFVRPIDQGYELRWFAANTELPLCGHATLASAHVLWTEGICGRREPIRFHTKGGILMCSHSDDTIELNFPALSPTETAPETGLLDALRVRPSFYGKTKFDRFVVVESEDIVRTLTPNLHVLRNIPGIRGVIVTSSSQDSRYDFV